MTPRRITSATQCHPHMSSKCISLALALLAAVAATAAPENTRQDKVTVDEKTDAVIKGAVKWLASKQAVNGGLGTSGDDQRYPVAMSGYTLMAFQAAGQLPGEGEFGKNVTLGMNYLLDQVSPEGLFANR